MSKEYTVKLSQEELDVLMYVLADIQERITDKTKDFSIEPEFCEYEYMPEDVILEKTAMLEHVIGHQTEE